MGREGLTRGATTQRTHSRPPSCATSPALAATAMVTARNRQVIHNKQFVGRYPALLPPLYPSL